MSDQAAPITDVQPGAQEGGIGQGDEPSGLYAEALSTVPEHLRQHVEPHFKKWDSQVQKKMTEAAEFRKQWEPYQELGLNDLDPQELQELLQFREIASNEDQFKEWYQAVGQELGLTPQEQEDLFDDLEDQGMSPDKIQEIVQQAVSPLQERLDAQEYERQVQEHVEKLTQEMDALAAEHGDFNRQRVMQLAVAYGNDPKALQKAHADWTADRAEAQKTLLKDKSSTPNPAVAGGAPAQALQGITSFEDAKQAAREVVRQSQNA